MRPQPFPLRCGGARGGVEGLRLLDARLLEEVVCDPASGEVTELRPGPEAWAAYAYCEDTALYRERTEERGGSPRTEHTLAFSLPRSAGDAKIVESLLRCAREGGLAALVDEACGVRRLAGWSRRFGAARALRLVAATAESGAQPSEPARLRIELRSVDADPAPQVRLA